MSAALHITSSKPIEVVLSDFFAISFYAIYFFSLQSYENILISEELSENIVRGRTVANIFFEKFEKFDI